MTYKRICFVVLVILLAAGCGTKDPLQPTSVKHDIMPLTSGLQWTYDLYVYSPPSLVPMDTLEYIVKITGQTIIDQETWFSALEIFIGSGVNDTTVWYYALRDTGLVVRASAAASEHLRVKAPGTVGDEFIGFSEVMTSIFMIPDYVPGVILSLDEAVTVPMGNFSCYYSRLNYTGYDAQWEDYYAYNTGLVKSTLLVLSGGTYYPYISLALTAFSGA